MRDKRLDPLGPEQDDIPNTLILSSMTPREASPLPMMISR